MTALQSRTIWIGTHRTGVRLHPSMWDAFEIAERQGKTVHDVLFEIDRARGETSLSTAIRVCIVEFFRQGPRQERGRLEPPLTRKSNRGRLARAGWSARFDRARRARERKVVTGKVRLRWICEGQPTSTEDPITEDRMTLLELLRKSGDGDFLRAVAESVLQIRMEADVQGLDRRRPARTHRRSAQLPERLWRAQPRHAPRLTPAADSQAAPRTSP